MRNPFKKCCNVGTYEHTVPMAIKGRRQDVDYCIADIIAALNAANITTLASCCGHGRDNNGLGEGSIILEDGRELIVRRAKKGVKASEI